MSIELEFSSRTADDALSYMRVVTQGLCERVPQLMVETSRAEKTAKIHKLSLGELSTMEGNDGTTFRWVDFEGTVERRTRIVYPREHTLTTTVWSIPQRTIEDIAQEAARALSLQQDTLLDEVTKYPYSEIVMSVRLPGLSCLWCRAGEPFGFHFTKIVSLTAVVAAAASK